MKMNINYKERQIDFLSQSSGKEGEHLQPRYMAAQISLSLENLVILSIVAIMMVIFSFAMGIERGKKIALSVPEQSESLNTNVSSLKNDKGVVKDDVKAAPVERQKLKVPALSSQTMVKGKPAVEAVPAAVATAAAGSGAYTVQVASYKFEGPAQRAADLLKQKGFKDVYVLPKGSYTIVCVGNFQRKEDSSDTRRQLKSLYRDSLVRRL